MKTSDQNRINMLNTVKAVLDEHNDTWKAHVAFSEGYDSISETITSIKAQAQLSLGNPGASSAKELAKQSLSDAAGEVIGALRAYAKVNAVPELAAKVDFTASTIGAGKANDVVTRCRTIHAAADSLVSSLSNYGITAAKLTAFKRKIDAFESVKSAPRQSRVTQSAAAQLIPELIRTATSVLRDQLDGMVVQFKAANPTFYEEYFGARSVVDTRGGRSENTDVQPTPTPAPTPVPA